MARLVPFFAETQADVALLADELRKLPTLTKVREERRTEFQTQQIIDQIEGRTLHV